MTTREELLKGVVKVNDERIDRKDAEVHSESEVQGGRGEPSDTTPRDTGRHAKATESVLSQSKESLQEFVQRRADEVALELEDVSYAITQLEGEMAKLRSKHANLVAEQKQLKALCES